MEVLSQQQLVRITAIKKALDEVYPLSLPAWIEGFELDMAAEREIRIWEHMAHVYSTYIEGRALSVEQKAVVFGVISQPGFGYTLAEILKDKPESLTLAEVIEILDIHYHPEKASRVMVKVAELVLPDAPKGGSP